MKKPAISYPRSERLLIGSNLSRVARWLCATAFLVGFGPVVGIAQTLATGDPHAGQRIAETTCAACHGTDGNGTDPRNPKLAGQNPAYLYRQLWVFKNGTRKSEVMSGIVATLSDSDFADVASFYSRQPRKPNSVTDARLAAIGERRFFSGMPSCAMCHSSGRWQGVPMMRRMPMHGMMGMSADVPSLDGQHATYIVDQLNRFASGERRGTVMNRIAAMLRDTDKRALAEFLSGVR